MPFDKILHADNMDGSRILPIIGLEQSREISHALSNSRAACRVKGGRSGIMFRARAAILGVPVAVALAGCSFQTTLDALVDPSRQAEIVRTAQTLCRSPQRLQSQFSPDLWAQSQPLFPQLPRQCPTNTNVSWLLTTYNFNTSTATSTAVDRREFALVIAGGADGPWSEIQLNYQQLGDAERRIIGWHAARTTTQPASLAFIKRYDQMRWWASGGVALSFFGLIAALLWFRRRRKSQGKGWTDA